MPQTPRPKLPPHATTRVRPIQDVVTVRRQADKFPSVGMTLHSYRYDANDSRGRQSVKPGIVKLSRWQRLRRKVTLKRSVITAVVLFLLVGGWVGGKFVYDAHKLFGGNIFSILRSTKLKGESSGRVNILLAGNSADDPGHDGADLTDSIMVISIDTKDNKALLLSIPRDLWVNVPGPGGGHQKINDAYVVGQTDNFSASGYPSGGMGLLEQMIKQDFGITIDYDALIDYSALRDAVNAVGGIEVDIQSPDPRGLYDPSIDYATHGPLVKLTNGEHLLSGEQALDLARARGDAYGSYGFEGSDFERTQNQRLMLVALKSKAVSAGVLANPDKLTNLFDAIGNNVTTDFSLSDVHRLYDLTKNISGSNIQSLNLNVINGKNLLVNYAAPDGESALIPAAGLDDYSQIQASINSLLSFNPIIQENANVVVLNGTNTNGLAAQVKSKLSAQHINVSTIGDAANTAQVTTTIIDTSGGHKPATKAELIKLFGDHVTTENPYAGIYNADFIIVAGSDQTSNSSNPSSSDTSP